MSKRKWQRGRSLSPVEALIAISEGRPVYFHHKWTHHAWACGWQVRMLIASARAGRIYEASEIKEQADECDC